MHLAFLAASVRGYRRGHLAVTSATLPLKEGLAGHSTSQSVESPSLPVQASSELEEPEPDLLESEQELGGI